MSALSELRERVDDLENRVSILEKILLDFMEGKGVKNYHSDLREVEDPRTPIGFKPNKVTKR